MAYGAVAAGQRSQQITFRQTGKISGIGRYAPGDEIRETALKAGIFARRYFNLLTNEMRTDVIEFLEESIHDVDRFIFENPTNPYNPYAPVVDALDTREEELKWLATIDRYKTSIKKLEHLIRYIQVSPLCKVMPDSFCLDNIGAVRYVHTLRIQKTDRNSLALLQGNNAILLSLSESSEIKLQIIAQKMWNILVNTRNAWVRDANHRESMKYSCCTLL